VSQHTAEVVVQKPPTKPHPSHEVRFMQDYKIEFTIGVEDFISTLRRNPKNKTEFDRFCELSEKGLRNGHIDWNIVFNCAKDMM
jgi:hypothetical protein